MPLLGDTTAAVALAIFLAMFLTHLVRLPSAAKVAGYVCGIMLLEHRSEPWLYGIDRVVETIIGIGTATLVSLLPRIIRVEKPALACWNWCFASR